MSQNQLRPLPLRLFRLPLQMTTTTMTTRLTMERRRRMVQLLPSVSTSRQNSGSMSMLSSPKCAQSVRPWGIPKRNGRSSFRCKFPLGFLVDVYSSTDHVYESFFTKILAADCQKHKGEDDAVEVTEEDDNSEGDGPGDAVTIGWQPAIEDIMT